MSEYTITHPQFWRDRLKSAIKQGEIHRAIFDCSQSDWDGIQEATKKIIHETIPHDARILDAGCGIGSLIECLGERDEEKYTGVDIFPDLLAIARIYYPKYLFVKDDIRDLVTTKNKTYDFVVARSIFGMFELYVGQRESDRIKRELIRVGRHLLILDYPEPDKYKII